jgi:prephenate dehydratase
MYTEYDATGDIGFLGPAGTYCDEAAHAFAHQLGLQEASFVPKRSFAAIFDAVERGDIRYGVVALENSIEGPVTATLDSFASRNGTVILGEHVVDIRHCLAIHPEATPASIRRIASHPQALAQCRAFLERTFPGVAQLPVGSTSEAARMAAGDPEVAAISNERAAEIAGIEVVERGIEDHDADQTVFTLIARQGHARLFGHDAPMKTSLALYLHDDRPGALQMILSEFAYGGINLTKIQSRPTKRRLGEYMFFIEIDGAVNDEPVRIALDCLRLKLRQVKVLGCYPKEPSKS